jgi:thiosulfate/3-mercaptopyruvate sulfurtransferase
MIKAMGHDKVCVLDGGLPNWIDSGFQIDKYIDKIYPAGDFSAHPKKQYFCDINHAFKSINQSNLNIIDARSKGRFSGFDPDPRKEVRAGHIPTSINLPFKEVLDGHRIKSKSELCRIFLEIANLDQTLIFSCGLGVTACILALAANISGYKHILVYDGSLNEWGQAKSSNPISTSL